MVPGRASCDGGSREALGQAGARRARRCNTHVTCQAQHGLHTPFQPTLASSFFLSQRGLTRMMSSRVRTAPKLEPPSHHDTCPRGTCAGGLPHPAHAHTRPQHSVRFGTPTQLSPLIKAPAQAHHDAGAEARLYNFSGVVAAPWWPARTTRARLARLLQRRRAARRRTRSLMPTPHCRGRAAWEARCPQ